MTYKAAVDTDVLIFAFERIRVAIIAKDNDTDRHETRLAAAEAVIDVLLRGAPDPKSLDAEDEDV